MITRSKKPSFRKSVMSNGEKQRIDLEKLTKTTINRSTFLKATC